MSDENFDTENSTRNGQDFKAKFWRFVKYLSTRKLECWGFFVAGFLIATIF